MNKQEFLASLKAELTFLPSEERLNAVKYYEEYFEDAGEENEVSILRELGSPKQVAEKILENLGFDKNGMRKGTVGGIELKLIENIEDLEDSNDSGTVNAPKKTDSIGSIDKDNIQRTESVKQEQPQPEPKHEHKREESNNNQDYQKNYKSGNILIAVLLLLAAPLWLPVVISVFAVIISLFAAFFMLSISFFGVAVAGAAVAVSGIGLLVYGVTALFTSLFVAVTSIGYGFLCLGIGMILGYVFFRAAIFLFKWQFKITAKMLRALGGAVRNMFRGKKYSTA